MDGTILRPCSGDDVVNVLPEPRQHMDSPVTETHTLDFGGAFLGLQASFTTFSKLDMFTPKWMPERGINGESPFPNVNTHN
jgi:hypothetical protein